MRHQVFLRHFISAGQLLVLSVFFLQTPLWAWNNPSPPSTLFAGDLQLNNVIYTQSSWDPVTERFTDASGSGEIFLFPLDNAKRSPDVIPLVFENIEIDDSGIGPGQVVQGDVLFVPATDPLEIDLDGFVFTLQTLVLDQTGAHGSGQLQLPSTVRDPSDCGPAMLQLNNLEFHGAGGFSQVNQIGAYGPWRLAETGMEFSGNGFVADFTQDWKWNGWSGAGSPDVPWRGLILITGDMQSPMTAPVSNTGYLQAPFDFNNGMVESTGLTAGLALSQAYSYTTVAPFGHQVELTSGNLSLLANQVNGGSFHDGSIQFPLDAVRNAGSPVSADFVQLTVQPDLDLYGEITIESDMSWGEFVNGPDTERYTALGSNGDPLSGFYYVKGRPFLDAFLPLNGGDFYVEPDLNLAPIDMMETQDIQGAFFYPNQVAIFSEDLDLEDPLELGSARPGSWCHIGANGLSGSLFVLLDNDNIDLGNPANYSADQAFDTLFDGSTSQERLIVFRFVDSALYESDAKGTVTLGGPMNAELEFENLRFTSTAQIVAADVALPGPVNLEYWGVDLVGMPGETHVGVMSVRAGMIMLSSAGIDEPVHFDEPFWLIWGEVEPGGQFGNLSFDYSGQQKFDDFHYTTEAVALSEYVPALKGYLEVGGTLHYPYFGAGYLHILDEVSDIKVEPFEGRAITLSDAANGLFKPSELDVAANWGNGTADLAFTLAYDEGDQSGFQGLGSIGHTHFQNPMGATINFESGGGCLSIQESNSRYFDLGPVTNFSAARNIAGCACIEGDLIKQFSITGELEQSLAQNVMLRSATYGSMQQTWTPSTYQVNVAGDMFFSLLVGADLQMTGNADFVVDREAGFAEGRVNAKVTAAAMFSGLEANGEFEWHVGDYQSLQGRVAVDAYSLSLFGYGGAAGIEGGFFAGIGVPKNNAWILSDADPEFKINLDPLPDTLTGVYGYVEVSGSRSWSVLASAGFRLHVGLGAFVGTDLGSGVPGLPYALGNLGVEVWGEILGGLISARGWADLQILLPYPAGFQGTIGLEGCVGWLLCDQVDLTIGLNSAEGFYLD